MEFDLSPLLSKNTDSIDISGTYQLDSSYYNNTDIISLNPVVVSGKIYLNESDEECINCTIDGSMIINDSISLEELCYPFHVDYDDIVEENCKKCENVLDIFAFLWENIVLEVPLQFTKVSDLSKFHGDGWKLIGEEDFNKSNNPFLDLLKDYDKE